MMPYSKINVGDLFESPSKWAGSRVTYTVVNKCEGLIEVRSSYQHINLPKTFWRKPTDKIFTHRVYKAEPDSDETQKLLDFHKYNFFCTSCGEKVQSSVRLTECPFCGFKAFFDEELEYILVQDYGKYWYVIPKNKEKKWNTWSTRLDESEDFENDDSGEFPVYALPIGKSPSMITFKNFEIRPKNDL